MRCRVPLHSTPRAFARRAVLRWVMVLACARACAVPSLRSPSVDDDDVPEEGQHPLSAYAHARRCPVVRK
eukprot:547659-Rhodomonas_salina.1